MISEIAVCIVTYNHQQYIEQCIESVLAQKTEHKVVLYIGEDCSTDKTRDICIEYQRSFPDKIKLLLHKDNLGLVRNTFEILNKIKQDGIEYIAMLDGDDYWIDELKLQKQIDYLKINKVYGLVHTNISLLYDDKIVDKPRKNVPTGNVFDIISNYPIGNCSVMFKTQLLQYVNGDDFVNNKFLSVDYVMYVIFANYTKFGFIEDTTAVWRRGHDSVSNTNDIQKQIYYLNNDDRMWRYLADLYPERFAYNEKSAEIYIDYRTFNIAFQYKDFGLANKILKKGNLNKRNFIFEVKKMSARNKILFNLWCWLKER